MNRQPLTSPGTSPALDDTDNRSWPSPRFLPARWHGLLDFGAAITLIAAPLLLDLASPAREISIAAGILLTAYSLLADYGLGWFRLIPIRMHLTLDLIAGVALLATPLLLGFDPFERIYFLIMGLGVFVAVAITDPS